MPQAAVVPAVQRNITQLRWEEGKRAPETMSRGAAVVEGNTVYISINETQEVYSCFIISGDQQWSTLARHQYRDFSLVLINGLLTSVGGYRGYGSGDYANSLLSLTGEGGKRQWSEVFPAMPTPRSDTASVTTEEALIVAGGYSEVCLDTVEVLDIPSQQWSTASCLPHPFHWMSATVCGDQLYLTGGIGYDGYPSISVLTCFLTDLLLPPQSQGARLHTLSLAGNTGVWRQASDLPVTRSTLTTLGGHLLAIGGADDSRKDTAAVYCYDARTDSWRVVSQMNSGRYASLAAALPENQLLVVGGWTSDSKEANSLEIGRIL